MAKAKTIKAAPKAASSLAGTDLDVPQLEQPLRAVLGFGGTSAEVCIMRNSASSGDLSAYIIFTDINGTQYRIQSEMEALGPLD